MFINNKFQMTDLKNKKSIIIYFSRAGENYEVGNVEKGNTEVIAEYLQEFSGADMFKVEKKIPYSENYHECCNEAQKEIDNNERPELANTLDNIDDYEIIYIGGPIFRGQLPQPMVTQLEKLNWEGKIVRPFVTHEGSGLAKVGEQLKGICKGAKVLDGLAIRGSSVHEAKSTVEKWHNLPLI